MSTAVIAAVAALAGVGVGKLLDVWGEKRHWLRDQKANAYGAFDSAAVLYAFRYREIVTDYVPDEWGEEERNIIRGKTDALGRVQLFGAPEVGAKAVAVLDAIGSPHDSVKETRDYAFGGILDAYRNACRKDLGVK